jgi:hypothetical protein
LLLADVEMRDTGKISAAVPGLSSRISSGLLCLYRSGAG